eukprot:TRINITY_DN7624_c1_g3_i3.p1 TRINITY_DN7624_c1_g3~~TRINITY_DN7624_c1_g3_i3.p1  ORF type:complete len:290 (+),score=87.70 TRINITY_DN7624_c1_g3_i3:53-871(+)
MPGFANMTTIEAERLGKTHNYRAVRMTNFRRRTFNINAIAKASRHSGALVIRHKTVAKNKRGGMDPVMMVPGGAQQQLMKRLKAEFGSDVRVYKTYPEGYVVAEDEQRAKSDIVRVNAFPVGPAGRSRQSSVKLHAFIQQEASQLGVERPGVYAAGDGFNVHCHSSDNADKVFEGFSALNGVVREGVLLACVRKAVKNSKSNENQSNTPPHMQCSTWSHQRLLACVQKADKKSKSKQKQSNTATARVQKAEKKKRKNKQKQCSTWSHQPYSW